MSPWKSQCIAVQRADNRIIAVCSFGKKLCLTTQAWFLLAQIFYYFMVYYLLNMYVRAHACVHSYTLNKLPMEARGLLVGVRSLLLHVGLKD